MRTLFGWFGLLLLLSCLAAPAEADGMRPLNGGRSPFMFAPARPLLRFHGPMIGHSRPFIPRGVVRRQALTHQFTIVNPGPVPPLTGTIVPPLSVGGTVHTNIVGLGNRLVIRKHRFAFGTFPGHDKRDRFHRFHGGFPAETFFLLGEMDFPDQVEMLGDTGEEARTSDVVATPPSAPVQSVARSAGPTWRSGRSVLTGTLEQPQIIFVSPARESRKVRIFVPSSEQQGKAVAPAPQVVEVPAQ